MPLLHSRGKPSISYDLEAGSGRQTEPKPSQRGEPCRIPQHISPLPSWSVNTRTNVESVNPMWCYKNMYHSNRVDPPLGDEYPQADEAFVILNSLSSHTSPRAEEMGPRTNTISDLIEKKMSSRLILKQFRNLIYWNSFQLRSGISILIRNSTKTVVSLNANDVLLNLISLYFPSDFLIWSLPWVPVLMSLAESVFWYCYNECLWFIVTQPYLYIATHWDLLYSHFLDDLWWSLMCCDGFSNQFFSSWY